MKNLFSLLLISTCFICGCDGDKPESPLGLVLQGEHSIRAITTRTTKEGQIEGEYFLFCGDVHGNTSTMTKIRFAWLGNDGNYSITDLPVNKIKIRIDDTKSIPIVKFKWSPDYRIDPDSIQEGIIYALIICNSKDVPQQTGENLQNIFKNE